MSYYLALDAGGTKTDIVLADETRQMARVRTGSIKRLRVSAETAARHLDQGLAELTQISGIPMSAIRRTCIGTAGETVPLVTDWLHAAFAQRVSGDLILTGDVSIALDAAFPNRSGVLVLAGTGSNVAGRIHDGDIITAGGWGPVLSDQGSGYRIGLRALRNLFLAIDMSDQRSIESSPHSLLRAVMEFWKLDSLSLLVEHANRKPEPDFSGLTTIVLACAEQGDLLSRQVLQQEAAELACIASIVIRKLKGAAEDSLWLPAVAFTGSILEKVHPVRESLVSSLRSSFPGIDILPGIVDPIEGALLRAREGV